jgi:hypothetical protein
VVRAVGRRARQAPRRRLRRAQGSRRQAGPRR